VNIGNNRVFLKRYEDNEGVFPLTGDHGSFGVAIRISAITGDMLEDLKGMIENYPALDDEATSQAEHEQIDEAWGDWAHYDFIIALGNHLPGEEERIDALDDDQARELFDRARRRLGAEWVQDSTGLFIDVVPIAEAVKPDDFDEPVAASPKEASVPMQNPEDIAISLGATLDEDTKEWLAGSLANDENSSDDELRELYAANGLSAKQIDMALSIRQWFETDFGAHL
jgi:hypothetical protein